MLKFFYVILMNLFRAPYMITKMRYYADHKEKYDEVRRYKLAMHVVYLMNRTGKVKTIATGIENLPKEGGYVMVPNHQGKYDALGIMYTHKEPCAFIMDERKSHTILVNEFVDLTESKRLKIKDLRQTVDIFNETAKEIREKGRKFIIFPEGGYKFNNRNIPVAFKPGSFKVALKAKAPIVPIALIDSYKVYNSYHLGPVTTYVHYLKPIPYEEYKNMRTNEIAEMVRQRILDKIAKETA